ncbi:unnamed protein product [Penicillium camemberti]|uniref:Str. FM013 n=1 Tax=Penicillium camemberti (strain FM 013) TaxID=1429867 RepID=A0A0G4PXA2_PENC3|nr:unnamed protein product [Penicillium camemberti]
MLYKGIEYNKVDQYLREGTATKDEALRANKEDAAPISDDEEVKETEDIESNIESEALY